MLFSFFFFLFIFFNFFLVPFPPSLPEGDAGFLKIHIWNIRDKSNRSLGSGGGKEEADRIASALRGRMACWADFLLLLRIASYSLPRTALGVERLCVSLARHEAILLAPISSTQRQVLRWSGLIWGLSGAPALRRRARNQQAQGDMAQFAHQGTRHLEAAATAPGGFHTFFFFFSFYF